MKFRATFKERLFIVIVSFGLILSGIFGSILQHNNSTLIFSISCLALMLIVLLIEKVRFYVIVTDEILEARTLTSTKRLRWADIYEIKSVSGGGSFDYIGKDTAVRINFNRFSRDCYKEVLKQVSLRNLELHSFDHN